MRPTKLLHVLLLSPFFAIAQIHENFSDGDFTSNPQWIGNTSDWIVNSSFQLQSNSTVANSTFYLSTANTLATVTQWEFYVRLKFNTSSANYVDVFLTASASDLVAVTTTGYFVRIGSTQDDICLYRKDAGGIVTKLIDGVDGITNFNDNTLKIKVIREAGNQFTLYRDTTGTGNGFISEGSVVDSKYTTCSYFGFLVKQSTSSFFKKHYFGDIVVQPYVADTIPPSIQNVTALSVNSIDVLFSEPVDLNSSQTVGNYVVNNNVGIALTAIRDAVNTALVHISFTNNFPNGATNTITINGVKDLAGNAISNGKASFSFYIPQQYDIVIDEIMAVPTPQVSLPNAKFIELKNISGRTINLSGWKLNTSASSSGAFPNYNLPADSFLIITSTSNAVLFSSYGRVLGIPSFPAPDNNGTMLSLISKEGKTIHAMAYSGDWYQNIIKQGGGWTLEMVDTHNPCAGITNWKPSTDASGGTPGRKNSVDALNNDQTPPQLLRTYNIDSVTIIAVFDKPLDSLSAAIVANYSLDNNSITAAQPLAPLFNRIILKLSAPLQKRKIYTLTVFGAKDCNGNAIGIYNKAKAGWAEEALTTDVVINEILFNPKPGAFDYVEIYNRSNKIVDANKLYIANKNSTGGISSTKKMSESPFYFFPGDYIVLTENALSLQNEYLVKHPNSVLAIPSLPSYPNAQGNVVIVNSQGAIVDQVSYTEKWHFALLNDVKGISLERIDPDGISQDANNWHSAASTAGYGTPSYKNSQYKQPGAIQAAIEVNPKIFSPDNDGHDDFAIISYLVGETGNVANITIFDANGRLVRSLVNNELLGLNGRWSWDGLGEKKQKLPIGTYIIFTELFNQKGEKKTFKNTVVLARKLN